MFDEFNDKSATESECSRYWVEWFLSIKGHDLFCDVDDAFITDRFNLTGLNAEVPYFRHALNLILDNLDEELEKNREEIEKSARHLYGLIHSRFIVTSRGLKKMAEKFKRVEFGRCPRVLCYGQPVLPIGISDIPGIHSVKFYCPRCEDCYNPKASRQTCIDGCFFGTTYAQLLLQSIPDVVPAKTPEQFVPRVFGFKIHGISKQQRKQEQQWYEQKERLSQAGLNW